MFNKITESHHYDDSVTIHETNITNIEENNAQGEIKKSSASSKFISLHIDDENFKRIFSGEPHYIETRQTGTGHHKGTWKRIHNSLDADRSWKIMGTFRYDIIVLNVIAVGKQYTIEVNVDKETKVGKEIQNLY